jgi:hypothetical protein
MHTYVAGRVIRLCPRSLSARQLHTLLRCCTNKLWRMAQDQQHSAVAPATHLLRLAPHRSPPTCPSSELQSAAVQQSSIGVLVKLNVHVVKQYHIAGSAAAEVPLLQGVAKYCVLAAGTISSGHGAEQLPQAGGVMEVGSLEALASSHRWRACSTACGVQAIFV